MLVGLGLVVVACGKKSDDNTTQTQYWDVVFESAGGSIVNTQRVKDGEYVTRPQNPNHSDGYVFEDWYSDRQLTMLFDFGQVVNNNIIVYAKWGIASNPGGEGNGGDNGNTSPTLVLVTLFGNGGEFGNGLAQVSKTVEVGKIFVPETPTRINASFDGWYLDSATTTAVNFATTPVMGAMDAYAKWQISSQPKPTIQVSFDAKGGQGLSIQSKQVVVGERYGVLASVVPPSGQVFKGWYNSIGNTLVTQTTVVATQSNHTLYAQYGTADSSSTSPDAAASRFEQYLSEETYDVFFPYRKGISPWDAAGAEDFYSYNSLIQAIKVMANLKIRVKRNANDLGDVGKIWVTDKTTGIEINVFTSVGFDANSNALFEEIVDYGSFLGDGDANTQKKELAAFLANLSHESTGGGYAATTREWGLFFNQESGLTDDTVGWYTTSELEPNQAIAHANFPPNATKSYHGRGPIQLSWNYNYGLFSSILYGDKQVLLDDPNAVCRVGNGWLAFASAIWFWMTPQGLKPSCHDVMTGVYKPNAQDVEAGRTIDTLGIAWTIVIINGYYEADKGREGGSVGDRILFYEFFTGNAWHDNGFIPGVTTTGIDADITGDKLDTLGMRAYAW
jgi:uncharacterized repeat protein (TIGR02543 family)